MCSIHRYVAKVLNIYMLVLYKWPSYFDRSDNVFLNQTRLFSWLNLISQQRTTKVWYTRRWYAAMVVLFSGICVLFWESLAVVFFSSLGEGMCRSPCKLRQVELWSDHVLQRMGLHGSWFCKPGVFFTNTEGDLVHLCETPRDMTNVNIANLAESGYSFWDHHYDSFTYKQ